MLILLGRYGLRPCEAQRTVWNKQGGLYDAKRRNNRPRQRSGLIDGLGKGEKWDTQDLFARTAAAISGGRAIAQKAKTNGLGTATVATIAAGAALRGTE